MSLKGSRLPALSDKLEPENQDMLETPSEVEVEEEKIKRSKKPAKNK